MPLLNSPTSVATQIPGGDDAPGRARGYVLERLAGWLDAATASDGALIVSELVTNSVIHANAGRDLSVGVELARRDDLLCVAVTDHGAPSEPRLLPDDPMTPGGFGLRLVQDLSAAWGVMSRGDEITRVWCELRLDPALSSRSPRTPATAWEAPTSVRQPAAITSAR